MEEKFVFAEREPGYLYSEQHKNDRRQRVLGDGGYVNEDGWLVQEPYEIDAADLETATSDPEFDIAARRYAQLAESMHRAYVGDDMTYPKGQVQP